MSTTLSRIAASIVALAIPLGVLMLVFWTASVLLFETPGWVHLFLTLGVFFLIWGIVRRGTPPHSAGRR